MSLVLPGVAEVLARDERPQSELMSEDLPTLLLPMNANSGSARGGLPCALELLPANVALLILILLY